MKPIRYILIIAIIFMSGCQKSLNFLPETSLSAVTFWKTATDFREAVNTCYLMLPGNSSDDIKSDFVFSAPNSISNGTQVITEQSGLWTTSYSNIRICNIILEKGKDNPDVLIQRYVAEARFFRAFNYWQLFDSFGGVPLITKTMEPTDANLYAPRASRDSTVSFILSELAEAANILPEQNSLSANDYGRITKGAANSLIARIALFEGTWQEFRGNVTDGNKYLDLAISASNTVITSGQYALYKTGDIGSYGSYFNLFIEAGEGSSENILQRLYKSNLSGNGWPVSISWYGFNPTKKMVDMYLDTLGLPISKSAVFEGYNTFSSEFMHRDPRMTQTLFIPGTFYPRFIFPNGCEMWPGKDAVRIASTGYMVSKWTSSDPMTNNNQASGYSFANRIIRYAEVLLIYAEAKYERHSSVSDDDLNLTINDIRDRVKMPKLTNAFVAANNLDMREEIRREREVELALEGFRYDDLRRWKTAETELPMDIKGVKIRNGSEWATRDPYSNQDFDNHVDANGFLINETGRKFNPAKDYLQPLPTKEIALYNTNGYVLEQNPGW